MIIFDLHNPGRKQLSRPSDLQARLNTAETEFSYVINQVSATVASSLPVTGSLPTIFSPQGFYVL